MITEHVKLEGQRISAAESLIGLQEKDRSKLKCLSWYVIVQCIIIFAFIASVLQCLWNPDHGLFEFDILSRIMYLYDTNACGKTRSLRQFKDLHLSNETFGLNIIPVRHEPVSLNVLTKLSGKTRKYLKAGLGFHITWLLSALLLWIFIRVKNIKVLKIILRIFYYVTISIAIFDVCMAIVYIADIQQSLTKAMIIRYSGWGMTPRQVDHPEEFGGWVPLVAASVWLLGGIFFFVNIYLIRFVKQVMQKIRGREVKSRISTLYNVPFPEADSGKKEDQESLYYRAGNYDKLYYRQ